MKSSLLFIHDDATAAGGRLDVEICVVSDLTDFLQVSIVSEQVHRVVPVGQEIDSVTHPDRKPITGFLVRNLLHFISL